MIRNRPPSRLPGANRASGDECACSQTALGVEDDEEEPDEPWKASVPAPPFETESSSSYEDDDEEDDQARLALLPIGNVVRGAGDRHHEDVAADAREMLQNLLAGRARGAVDKAIDDLLDSL